MLTKLKQGTECCELEECHDIAKHFMHQFAEMAHNINNNRIICDHTKAKVLQNASKMLAVGAGILVAEKITPQLVRALQDSELVLMPKGLAKTFESTIMNHKKTE